MRSSPLRLLVLASFLASTGMVAAALQSVAWAKMAVDFARRETIAVSLRKTFDGRHPCPICSSLKKAADPASFAAAPIRSRLGFAPPSGAPRAVRVAAVWSLPALAPSPLERAFRPASPPPKTTLA